MLYSLTPLTTFLTVPIWSMLTATDGGEKCAGNGKSNSSRNEKATRRSFTILYSSILIATASQISLAILDKPIWMMLAIVIAGIFQSPVKPILDGIIMGQLKDKGEFGKVRFFSILGTGFGTNLGGRLLSMVQDSITDDGVEMGNHGRDNTHDNVLWNFVWKLSSGFNLLFLARTVLTIPPMLFIRQLHNAASTRVGNGDTVSSNLTKEHTRNGNTNPNPNRDPSKKEDSTPMRSVAQTVVDCCFRDTVHLLFFVCIYIAGASGGVSDAFSYPRYQESGCSTAHIGQSRLLSSVAGATMFWYSGSVSQMLGIQNVLVLSMMSTGARFSLLKRMDHPCYAYLIDIIRGTTYGVFWSSSTIYATQIAPPEFRSTVLLLLNGIYNGIGRSTGAILGGKFQALFGIDNLFFWCSRANYALAFAMAILCYRNETRGSEIPDDTRKAKKLE